MSYSIEAQHVSKTYRDGGGQGVTALSDVSCAIAPGEFVALVGPSGGGKSTLLNLLGAMDTPDAGEIRIQGRSTTGLADTALTLLRRTQVGFVFQFFNLLPALTAVENVELPLLLQGDRPALARVRASEVLTLVGLGERLHHTPSQLSGGQMQRVAIARAIVHRPAVLLADEPTGNLDSQTGEQILMLLRQLSVDGQTIVMATHGAEASAAADRVLLLRDGRLSDG
jgi:putative ABC transport system ATP-binding protein